MRSSCIPLPLSLAASDGWVRRGKVIACDLNIIKVHLPGVSPGTVVQVETAQGLMHAEVRTVCGLDAVCSPLINAGQVSVGASVVSLRATLGAYCGGELLGSCVDAWGRAASSRSCRVRDLSSKPLAIADRYPITRKLATGVAAIDGLCTIGVGQRVALFSGAGVGKSTLLRTIAEQAQLDAHVVALIGERGREAAETVAALRASEAWPRTTVVCATAETSPRERVAAAKTAVAQAEWLCEHGLDVLLTVDSLTRVAHAWRELALSSGEPAAHRGHPASMIGMLASIVERAGARKHGSITGVYAVLVDGDDPFEPVTDAVRGLLDGHIVLARHLADAGRFPPIDVLRSISRLMTALSSSQHLEDAATVRRALAALERADDLFAIGAYKPGGDPWLDSAVIERRKLDDWIFHGSQPCEDAVARLAALARSLRDHVDSAPVVG